jgi:NDP-sugar pyrophosphorylase family protein
MINIVIPMAGAGSRFSNNGYKVPKPLILINGIPMIKLVIKNLKPNKKHRFIFICQKAHIEEYDLDTKLKQWAPKCILVGIDAITEGAACTVLKAAEYIDSKDQLMIANSDQYVDIDINKYLDKAQSNELDGMIMTMNASDSKWSYIGINENNLVNHVVEKKVISNEATVGIYNFSQGSDFILAANNMILENLRVNNEFYVAPVYNQMLSKHAKIGYMNIGSEANGMYGLGTPDDLNLFLSLPISKKATL